MSLANILSVLLLGLLAAARFAGADAIMATWPQPHGTRIVVVLGVLTAIAAALLLDRMVRTFYWDGYLRQTRGRETPLVIEGLVTVMLLLLGGSLGLYFEAGVSFAGLATASGATAVLLGIALQAVINDIFSGASVNLDGAFAIGDWLTIYASEFPEPVYGQVQGITWRTTLLGLKDGRRLMVPNHLMTSRPVLNHSRPAGPKRFVVEVPLASTFPVERAIAILLGEAYRAVRKEPLVSQKAPDVLVDRITADAVFFHVRFYADLQNDDHQLLRSIMAQALHQAVLRHELPSPVTQVELISPAGAAAGGQDEGRIALGKVAIFQNILSDAHLDMLAQGSSLHSLAAGETLIRQGDAGHSMFVILEGAARVFVTMPDGQSRDVAVVVNGDIVGEMSLMTGAPRAASVVGLTALRVLEVGKDSIEGLLSVQRNLADRLSEVLAARQMGLSEIASTPIQRQALQRDILAQMRKFFSRAFG